MPKKSLKEKMEYARKKDIHTALMRIVCTLIVVFGFVFLFGFIQIHSPDVIFESSDGYWGDSELQFKGRDYSVIEEDFHRYKEQCTVGDVYLVRNTEKNWVNVFAWPNYLFHEKWKAPYRPKSGVRHDGVVRCHSGA